MKTLANFDDSKDGILTIKRLGMDIKVLFMDNLTMGSSQKEPKRLRKKREELIEIYQPYFWLRSEPETTKRIQRMIERRQVKYKLSFYCQSPVITFLTPQQALELITPQQASATTGSISEFSFEIFEKLKIFKSRI